MKIRKSDFSLEFLKTFMQSISQSLENLSSEGTLFKKKIEKNFIRSLRILSRLT